MARAFVYTETFYQEGSKSPTTFYVLKFQNSKKSNGCSRIQSLDEKTMREEIKRQASDGVSLLSRLPPSSMVEPEEGVIRTPYDISWLK